MWFFTAIVTTTREKKIEDFCGEFVGNLGNELVVSRFEEENLAHKWETASLREHQRRCEGDERRLIEILII